MTLIDEGFDIKWEGRTKPGHLTSGLITFRFCERNLKTTLGKTATKMASHCHSVHHPITTIILLLGLLSTVYTQVSPDGPEFLFPADSITLHYNDWLEVQYISNFSTPWMGGFCHTADGSFSIKFSQAVGSFNNTVMLKLNWTGSDTPCWFSLKQSLAFGSTGPSSPNWNFDGANSANWNFNVTQRDATTVGLEPTSATSSTSTASSVTGASSIMSASTSVHMASSHASTSSTTSTVQTTPTTSSKESSGLSTGALAGIGIGAAAAGICSGAAAVFMCMRRRRQCIQKKVMAARIEELPAGGWGFPNAGELRHQGGYPPQLMRQKESPVTEMDSGYPAAQELHDAPVLYEMPTHAD